MNTWRQRDFATPMVNKVVHDDPDLARLMRHACPLSGNDWTKFMRVELIRGDTIPPHEHRRHTVLYYPQAADPIIVTPCAGALVYLSPGTTHAVPVVDRPRVSYAMLIDP